VPSTDRSLPLILFPEGCAYWRFALSTLREHGVAFHISFVGPSFECLKSAVVEGLGITVLARGLVSPPLRVIGQRTGLPPLPTVEVVYTFGNEQRPRVVTELTHFLAHSMTNAGSPHLANAA
jgi:DNA-binding transcriptional LysR family regulator